MSYAAVAPNLESDALISVKHAIFLDIGVIADLDRLVIAPNDCSEPN